MIESLIKADYIQLADKAADWKEAIKMASQPMIENGDIDPKYIDAMIETVLKFGTYIVIAPSIALPHARGDG